MSRLTRGLITAVIGGALLTILQELLGVEVTGAAWATTTFRIVTIVYGGVIAIVTMHGLGST